MASLSPIDAEITWSLIVIGYGIWKERHFVSVASALVNFAGFLMVLASTDLPSNLQFLLGFYMLLGWAAIDSRNYTLMELLGSKPYGSLTLAIGLAQLGTIPNDFNTILFYWIMIAIASHIAMMYFAPEETTISI